MVTVPEIRDTWTPENAMMHIYTCLYESAAPQFPASEFTPTEASQPLLGRPDSLARSDEKRRPSAREIFSRSAIGHYCNCTPESIVIERDARGKPQCNVPKKRIHFNLSHSGRWMVCAVAEQVLGIDVQQIMPLSSTRKNKITLKILTEEEQRTYTVLPDSDRTEFLYHRFSMKESCAKAVGLGLRIPFNTISLKEQKNYFTWKDRTTQFFIREYFLDPEYTLFLCSTDRSVAEIRPLQ